MRRALTGLGLAALSTLAIAASAPGEGPGNEPETLDHARKVDERCRRLEQEAQAELDLCRFAEAVQGFERLRRERRGSPFLTSPSLLRRTSRSGAGLDMALFQHRVEVQLYDRAVGQKAYAEWRAGAEREAEATLAHPRDVPSELPSVARLFFSEFAARHAQQEFEQGRWDAAARAFAAAADQRLAARSGAADDEWGRQRLNLALALYNAQRPAEALGPLLELRQKLPRYRPDEIEREIADARRVAPARGAGAR